MSTDQYEVKYPKLFPQAALNDLIGHFRGQSLSAKGFALAADNVILFGLSAALPDTATDADTHPVMGSGPDCDDGDCSTSGESCDPTCCTDEELATKCESFLQSMKAHCPVQSSGVAVEAIVIPDFLKPVLVQIVSALSKKITDWLLGQ